MKIIKYKILELIHTKILDSRRDVFIRTLTVTVVSTGSEEANSCSVEPKKIKHILEWNLENPSV